MLLTASNLIPKLVWLRNKNLHSVYNKSLVDSLWGHPEVLLDEIEGHPQGNQGDEKSWSDGGNDPDGWQTQQRGSRQRFQRWRDMLRERRTISDTGSHTVTQISVPQTSTLMMLNHWHTWSMMLVSAENLLRICPRGVMSKNLRREEINHQITQPKTQSLDWIFFPCLDI